ncbi:O-methyltransferase [Drepanopeziza brunnea f. sp. 'multigermtubi' MB_m1]|uniref:O-methyltransferase n=1 Tax=Marssonina brunnea f. sp. multigermtubi (strain MB_m1) TaxID=1072389 RepID=K1X3C4_MARBU|nr:O-methyltransferase [Drepanopeziza brunnea f. sp. 'multigermtubi' MB_m1]EKD19716.1 O-methyltransferase [Drepanopeziza brunnea f. sp. 'multigermtubi' MB_m1]
MLTSTGIIVITGEDTYAHTPKSKATPSQDLTWLEYLKTHTPEELIDLRKTAYTYAYGQEGQTFYEILHADAARFTVFNKAMMQQEASLPTLGMFPFSSLQPAVDAEPDRLAAGADRRETGDSFGTGSRLVLQDRSFALDSVPQELLKGIEKCPYDFCTEQPVKKYNIFFLRRITHNYQNGGCTTILTNIAAAMGPTSRLLITEAAIPARATPGEDLAPYCMDMLMISIGGKERAARGNLPPCSPARACIS